MAEGPASRILVVDDERPILMTLEALLTRHGHKVYTASTASAGLSIIDKFHPEVVLLDIGLPDANGLETLETIKSVSPDTSVLILTANDSLDNAIKSIKLGAFHFISKPYVPEELLSLLARATEQRELMQETKTLRAKTEVLAKRLEKAEKALAPVFLSRRMKEIEELITRIAPSEANILLTGESGVGKEVMANRVHELSGRAPGPMVKLNCAAFPQNMIEAELFGYVKGAFTGAVSDFPGMISEARGGTLFLDEIAEMPPDLQTRFLRVLQEREYRPLGSTKTVGADFRLVAATNQKVPEALRNGTLRQDLYYRLNTFQIEIPPLRERKEDIPAMVKTFARRFARQLKKPAPNIASEAFNALVNYPWPGNVRELQNVIEYCVVLSEGNVITENDLPRDLTLPPILRSTIGKPAFREDTLNLENREREAIIQALSKSHGNKKKAAEILGIHRPTLYNKIKRYAIDV
jgi:DNA-binding NtrC family response regulator